jgi:cupin 2 domain-containing protein
MAEEDLRRFLDKVRQLNAFVALSEQDERLRRALRDCTHHHQVVALARRHGFEIGRRWGDPEPTSHAAANLLAGPCPQPGEEVTTVLLRNPLGRLERIHSCSASSPPGFWYDQRQNEWITLLQGSARLELLDPDQILDLSVGDTLLISARRRHRVLETDPAPGTIWLALFWSERSP